MPEELSPEWEYYQASEEIDEILREDAQYRNIGIVPFSQDSKGCSVLDGFRIGRPNGGITRLAPGSDFIVDNGKQLFEVNCLQCGYKFKQRHERNVYCSNACFGRSRSVSYARTCVKVECAQEFVTSVEKRRFCSESCARSTLLLRRFNPTGQEVRQCDGQLKGSVFLNRNRNCVKCGKAYEAKRAHQKQCSTKCNGASYRKLAKRPCAWCQNEFQPLRSYRRFCCMKCAGRYVAKFGPINQPKTEIEK